MPDLFEIHISSINLDDNDGVPAYATEWIWWLFLVVALKKWAGIGEEWVFRRCFYPPTSPQGGEGFTTPTAQFAP